MDKITSILLRNNIFSHVNEGIHVASVVDPAQGLSIAKEMLVEISDTQTVLYLSGGRTPKEFYAQLSDEAHFEVGAIGLIDERFGSRFHENSNEKMLMDSGIIQSLEKKGTRFYPILTGSTDREEIASEYDDAIRSLHAQYQKSVGILGVGVDGHTAGIPADPEAWKEFDLDSKNKTEMVVSFDDHGKFYGERVTQTFLGLSMLDLLVVMVFGDDKKDALEKMFSDGPEDEIPSRFFKRPDVATKTILITDQKN